MALTQKQEAFCLAYIETGNASEAYRRSYNAEKMNANSIGRKAKELIDNVKITARLEELRAPVRKKALLTLEGHLARLNHLSMKAEKAEQFGPAIKAEESRGKAAGLYVEKVEIGGPDAFLAALRETTRKVMVDGDGE